jgi:peptide/nickel transport system substrate-binding protein
VKEIRAKDSHTVEYELNAPFSELLSQLTLFFAMPSTAPRWSGSGDNFGAQGFNGTGPFCWVQLDPAQRHGAERATRTIAGARDRSRTAVPAHLERVTWRVIPGGRRPRLAQSRRAGPTSRSTSRPVP